MYIFIVCCIKINSIDFINFSILDSGKVYKVSEFGCPLVHDVNVVW